MDLQFPLGLISTNEKTPSSQGYESDLTEYYTIGPSVNEGKVHYAHNGTAHVIKVVDRVSPEVLLVFQSKIAGLYLKVGENRRVLPINRAVKSAMLRAV